MGVLRAALALAGSLVLIGGAAAGDATIAASGAWARPTLGQSRTVAAYLTIRNDGTTPDRLLAIGTSIAKSAEVHATVMDGDVMQMRRVAAVDLPPGGEAALAPGGMHVMLIEVVRALKAGDHFPLTLRFEHHAPVGVDVVVAMQPPSQ